jgi:uncharacterized membrane protein (DUF373 family)
MLLVSLNVQKTGGSAGWTTYGTFLVVVLSGSIGGLLVDLLESSQPARAWVARVFTAAEDVIYVGLGILLAGISFILLISGLISFGQNLMAGSLVANIVGLLDRILLILLVVELLYTVQVSFRERILVPEPFLLVGLIAVIRRVLVLTAELAQVHDIPDEVFRRFIMELGVLTLMIVALVVSLVLLRNRKGRVAAERAMSTKSTTQSEREV